MDLRSDPNAIDADWLTQVLQRDYPSCKVTDVAAESIGTGQVGENVRFSLSGVGAPANGYCSAQLRAGSVFLSNRTIDGEYPDAQDLSCRHRTRDS